MTAKKPSRIDSTTVVPLSVVWVVVSAVITAAIFAIGTYDKMNSIGNQFDKLEKALMAPDGEIAVIKGRIETLRRDVDRLQTEKGH